MKNFVILAIVIMSAQSSGECSRDPFSILSVKKIRDGGTVRASVTDSNGCLVKCRYDGKMKSPTVGRMYVNGRLARGAAEDRILRLLSAVVDSSMSRIRYEENQDIGDDDEQAKVRSQANVLEEVLGKSGWR